MFKKIFLKINILFFIMILTLFMTYTVSAHPPSKLNINYLEENENLFVNITHGVSSDDHYIESVEILINGEEFTTYKYNNQPNETSFSYNYTLSVIKGDVIRVKAECNRFGTLTRELVVGENNNGSSTPGFISVSIFISMLIMLFLYKRRLM